MKKAIVLLSLCALFSGCQTEPQAIDFEKEKAAIRAVIAIETESYYRQDFEAWKSTYLDSPAFRMYGYWEGFSEKVTFHNGFESLKTEKKKQFDANETLWQGQTRIQYSRKRTLKQMKEQQKISIRFFNAREVRAFMGRAKCQHSTRQCRCRKSM